MTLIRVLEHENNRRGDLFGRLMSDLFVALGYEPPTLNIQKAGREIDLYAMHRLERRRAVGECKVTAEPAGAGDLNKFAGVLTVERSDSVPTTGYFISLSGFTSTVRVQEQQRCHGPSIVLLDGPQVVKELVEGRIIVPRERAIDSAARFCTPLPHRGLDTDTELIAHERGWVWVIYYTAGTLRTEFALIHSDGSPVVSQLASEIVAADRACGGRLHSLTCLNRSGPYDSGSIEQRNSAIAAYKQSLTLECGFIQLDGLPADTEVGSRRMRLEDLFVPLHLKVQDESTRCGVGEALNQHSRMAVLAAPGSGKSTLIKRLAMAYIDPTRQHEIHDNLPVADWVPLFFRCRELRELARSSFSELLDALSKRELVRQHADAFRAYVDEALVAGRALLLVDGLDEIADEGDRAALVCTLRTALLAYPKTSSVLTSRQAGFRHVAAHLAPICTIATLSPFDESDIRSLSVAWHTEVIGNTLKVQQDAQQLAATIARSDRIRSLAENPLLLTTLFLVKRWIGSLPTRRAALYGKAAEVLLMTWNIEGHAPIKEDEAFPQLCYVAHSMMMDRVERISRPRLATLLREAREALPVELGYIKGSVGEFIDRVENRSGLLMMTGRDVEDGQLVEFFEFRHLAFQEFLTARAMVEGWHAGHKETDRLASVLGNFVDDEKWREVVPLAAALAGKKAELLIQMLVERVNLVAERGKRAADAPVVIALTRCLSDEAPAHPDTIQAAIRAVLCAGCDEDAAVAIYKGRYGTILYAEVCRTLLGKRNHWQTCLLVLSAIVSYREMAGNQTLDFKALAQRFIEGLGSDEKIVQLESALACEILLAAFLHDEQQGHGGDVRKIALALLPLLYSSDPYLQYIAGWGLFEVGHYGVWIPPDDPDVLGRMFDLWQGSPVGAVRDTMAIALSNQIVDRHRSGRHLASIARSRIDELLSRYDSLRSYSEKPGALIVAWYSRAWSRDELQERIKALGIRRRRMSGDDELSHALAHNRIFHAFFNSHRRRGGFNSRSNPAPPIWVST